ncbi:MAG: DUF6371 domain-containing protein [Psychroserpens sp.]|uniref:DUF6371 domain-containing protein n=1 Tax=Psychroserpens sp. TaxID=2020870 RepID=UPI0030016E5C
MLRKIESNLIFNNKRDYKLITPCCSKINRTGGFVNWKGIDSRFGFCNYCGKTTLPRVIFQDEYGNDRAKNQNVKSFDSVKAFNLKSSDNFQKKDEPVAKKNFINEKIIWKYFNVNPENKLLTYLRRTYGNQIVNEVKEMYALGTYDDSGTMFWTINKDFKVQKLKVVHYGLDGKRQNKFGVPYNNENGFHYCLFGEHLLKDKYKNIQRIVLVESEKTALVGAIVLPKYTWLAYGGLNGLTRSKVEVLKGYKKVLVIPDFSSNAINVMQKNIHQYRNIGVDIKMWDLTNGMTDEERKNKGIYNDDIEDILRNMTSEVYNDILI